MKTISAQQEEKLLSVIEKTAELVNAGDSPNDAIIKAAQEAGLRPGDINLVVHAFNTGRTNKQRQSSDDLFSKVAEFELADASTILEKMYPGEVKTAAAKAEDGTVSVDYAINPRDMIRRKEASEQLQCEVDWRKWANGEEITAPEPYPSDIKEQLKRASSEVDRCLRDVEEARRVKAAAFDQLGQTFHDLTTYFRTNDAKPIPVVKEAVILLHGDDGERIMDELVKVTPGLTKMAQHKRTDISIDDIDCREEPFPTIARFISDVLDYQTKAAAYDKIAAEKGVEAGKAIDFFRYPGVTSILDTSSEDEARWAKMALAGGPLNILGAYTVADKLISPIAEKLKPRDVDVNKTLASLDDPDHDARLRAINTQAMLQDLMLNDDVISEYDSDEVSQAYNDLVQISPSVADQRLLMQTLLRKKLQQGQLDTFEQDQLLGFEDQLRRQSVPLSQGTGDGSVI